MSNEIERGIISRYDLKKKTVKSGYLMMIVCIILLSLTMLYPFVNTFFTSLKSREEIFKFPVPFIPKIWLWHNYELGWNFVNVAQFMKNTLIIYAGNMAFSLLFIGIAAFALSHLRVPFKKFVQLFFMSTLLIPPATYMIPNFLNLQSLGLINSYWAFWLPAGANAFNLLLLKSFFDGINREMFEAARIDGASEFKCFYQIAVPLSIPIIATLLILGFSATWNEFYWSSLIITDKSKLPIAAAIYKYILYQGSLIPWNVRFAVLTMTMVPPVIFFLVFQKNIMRGLNVSGVKG
jgi:multiple sugar transport system permease protein